MNQPPGYPPGPPYGSPPGQPQGGASPQQPQYGQPQFGQAPQQGFGQPPQPQFGQAPQQPQFAQTPQFGQAPQQGFGPGSFSQNSGSALNATGEDGKWRWHYSRAIGVMYGPIPVGVIVVAVIAALWYGGRYF